MHVKQRCVPLLALLLLVAVVPPAAIHADDAIRYANYTTGDSSYTTLYADNWTAQTFNWSYSFTATHARVKAYRVGLPGTLTAAIQATNATGYPTGADLASGTYNANNMVTATTGEWYTIDFDDLLLTADTAYALVLRTTGDNTTNAVRWRRDDAGSAYATGDAFSSADGGTTWAAIDAGADDFMFEIWGDPALSLESAAVFSGYYETGDWLITLSYKNTYAPYYPASDPKSQFVVQLLSGTTVLAQTNLPQWGYKPTALYLSANTVAPLTWGGSYTVRMVGINSPYPSVDYALQSTDWRGTNLDLLDSWCISLAQAMATYYDTTFTVYTAEKGEVLNEEGGVIFSTGISGLMVQRPDLFQVAVSGIPYEDPTWTSAYSGARDEWYVQLGPDISTFVNSTADLVDTTGSTLLMLLLLLVYVILAVIMVSHGMNFGAFAVLSPFLIYGYMIRVLPWPAIGVGVAILVMLAMRQLWWKST